MTKQDVVSTENDDTGNDDVDLDRIGHPKGTLAILILYMMLFVLGWLGLYFLTFLPRGTPDADGDSASIEQLHQDPAKGVNSFSSPAS